MAIMAHKVQPAKTAGIASAKETLQGYTNFIFVNYRGMTVEQITKLRKQLREKNAQIKVIKNNFARIAFSEMSIDSVAEYLSGPTAIAMVKEDANESAKVLFDFAKDAPAPKPFPKPTKTMNIGVKNPTPASASAPRPDTQAASIKL